MRKFECFGHALGAGTLIERSACSALSRNCALKQLRTGAPALLFPFLFHGHNVVALVLSPWSVFSAHSSVLTPIRLVCMAQVKSVRDTFLKLDPSGRSGLASARKFQCLWCASQSPGKLGSKPRGMTSHNDSCCEFPVHSLDNSVRVNSRSERNEHGTIRSDSPENGGIC